MWAVNMINMHFLIFTNHMKLNIVGYRPSDSGRPLKLTISAQNGSEVRGFVVVQHQAQEAMAQILLARQGKIILLSFLNALNVFFLNEANVI